MMKTINGQYRKSLRYSLWDGIFCTVAEAFVSNYITPFLLALKANNFQIGLLNALPALAGVFAQLKSSDLMERTKNRVQTVTWAVYFEAAVYTSFLFIALYMKGTAAIYLILLLFTLLSAAGLLTFPIWLSLMSDTVDNTEYGRYFAWRNRIFGVILLISIALAGFLLDQFKGNAFYGFALLFGIAGMTRFISGIFLSRMTDIPVVTSESDRFTYRQFLFALPRSNFARFVVYVSAMIFAENLMGGFVSVYLLNELKFGYKTYMMIITAGALAGILTIPFWGKYTDKHGNAKIIKTASLFIPALPLLWIAAKNPFLIAGVSMLSSYLWAGFHLAESNFQFDACSAGKRTRCIAYTQVTKGAAASAGALLGGLLAMNLPGIIGGSKLLTLFALSAALKLIITAFMSGMFREVRDAEHISSYNFILKLFGSDIVENFVYLFVGKKTGK